MIRRVALIVVVALFLSAALWYGAKGSAEQLRDRVMREARSQFLKHCASEWPLSQGLYEPGEFSEDIQRYTWLELREWVLDDVPYSSDGYSLLIDLKRAFEGGVRRSELSSVENSFHNLLSTQLNLSNLLVREWQVEWVSTEGNRDDGLVDAHALHVLVLVQANATLEALVQGDVSNANAQWSKLSRLSGIACQSGPMTFYLHSRHLWDAIETICARLDNSGHFQDVSELSPLKGCTLGDIHMDVVANIAAFSEGTWNVWFRDMRESGVLTSIVARILEPMHAYKYWRFLDKLNTMAADSVPIHEYQAIWNSMPDVNEDEHTSTFDGPIALFLSTLPSKLERKIADQGTIGEVLCIDYFREACNRNL